MRIRISAAALLFVMTALCSPLMNDLIPDGWGIPASARSSGDHIIEPFRVDRDWDLDVRAQNWPGNGTENDPYILEDRIIDGMGYRYCIFIGNSSRYLIIRNCTITNATGNSEHYYFNAGITLFRSRNIMVENCTFEGNWRFGIYATEDCSNIEITGCRFRDNGLYAVYTWMNNSTISNCLIDEPHLDGLLMTGDDNIVRGNAIRNCSNSGMILYGDRHIVSRNIFSGSGYAGLEISGNRDCTVQDNEFIGNRIHAMDIGDDADNNTIRFNSMTECGIFIDMYSCDDNLITDDNTVNGGPVHYWIMNHHSTVPSNAGQVILDECENVYMSGLEMDGGSTGITAFMCSNISISDSLISNQNSHGISVTYSENISFERTNVTNSGDEGFYIYTTTPVAINGSYAGGNSREGISFEFCDEVDIRNTILEMNGWSGIYLYLSYGMMLDCGSNRNLNGFEFENIIGGLVRNCTVDDNTRSGVLVRRAGITVQGNSFRGNGHSGIEFLSARSSLVIENEIHDSRYAGILISYTSGILAADNSMFGCGIRMISSYRDDWLMQDIRPSNTVNGRSVLSIKEASEIVIPPDFGQIIIADCTNLSIPGHNIGNTSVCIQVGFSLGISIERGYFNDSYIGIEIFDSTVILDGNMICGNDISGVNIRKSVYNIVRNCTILENGMADIDIVRTGLQTISNNTMGPRGILLSGSEDERTFEQDEWNSHIIDDENTVNGKRVRYLVGKSSYSVPADTGQLIIVDSYGITASDLNLSGLCTGAQIGFSQLIKLNNITVDNCYHEGLYITEDQSGWYANISARWCGGSGMNVDNSYETAMERANLSCNLNGLIIDGSFQTVDACDFSDNLECGIMAGISWGIISESRASENGLAGIYIVGDYNEVINNTLIDNEEVGLDTSVDLSRIDGNIIGGSEFGINFMFGEFNEFSNNTITDSTKGFRMFNCDRNTIRRNEISRSTGIGMEVEWNCHENLIYLNNFIDNEWQVLAETPLNDFDNGSYGNYWSDYIEKYAPPAMNNGYVWDTPYEIPILKGEYDNFPLVRKVVNYDTDPPRIRDFTPDRIHVGSDLTFLVQALDNVKTTSVHVEYWTEESNHTIDNMSEVEFDLFAHSIRVDYSNGSLKYFFTARDLAGNSNTTDVKEVEIFDDIPPRIIDDLTSDFGTTGEPFTFHAVVSDNVGLENVSVRYCFENTTFVLVPMSGSYDHTLNITIPWNSTDPLYYTILASDIYGNINSTKMRKVEIRDNDPPTAYAGENITVYTGTEVILEGIGSYDNVGIVNYTWTIHIGGNPIFFSGPMAVYNFTIPGRYQALLNVSDRYGNWDVDSITITVLTRQADTMTVTMGPVMDIDNKIVNDASVTLNFQSNNYYSVSDHDGMCSFTIPGSSVGRSVSITISKDGYENATFTATVSSDGSLIGEIPRLIPVHDDQGEDNDGGEPIFIIVVIAALILLGVMALTLILIKMKNEKENISEE
ncbi:MAG: right-handed parallel beta-helix repeat-containing protein [Thermoplasmatota archaeon]